MATDAAPDVRVRNAGARVRNAGAHVRAYIDRHFLIFFSWPALIVMLAVTAVPFVATIGMGFTNYNLVLPHWRFIGFANFVELWHDPQTLPIIFNTLYIVIGLTVLSTALGLLLAVLMRTAFPGIRIVRSLYTLPIMTAGIVVAITWRAMFNNQSGWINYFLGLLHLPQPLWLGDPHLAIPVVIIASLWTAVPFQAILLFAGLLTVPRELQQAAEVDGASPFRVFWHVTLVHIRPVLFIVVLLRLIDGFRLFEQIQELTTGGPGIASTPLSLQIYNTGLLYQRLGYAAAMGVVLVLLVALTVGIIFLVLPRRN
jgi:multiple sugar transport system permease protein